MASAPITGYELLKEADDISAFLQGATGMQPEYLQLSTGVANLRYRWIDLDGVTLLWGHSEARAIWRDQMTDTGLHFGYVVASDGSVSVCGKDLQSDQAMVWQPDQEMEYILPGQVLVVEIGVAQHILDELGWSFQGDALARVSRSALSALTRVCAAALERFRDTDEYQTAFRERVLDCLEPVLEPWMEPSLIAMGLPASRVSRPYRSFQSARSLMDTMELEERLRLQDMCRKLGIPRSSLHHAFRKSVGIGPRRYFEMVRLRGARSALLTSGPDQTTVAAVAMSHGFSDFGRFSKLYRNQFGEYPSETLGK